ncbi:MAG: hypothetical protein ACI9MR_002986 [Myxococcota bacterium]|jgi:hypothetical protein
MTGRLASLCVVVGVLVGGCIEATRSLPADTAQVDTTPSDTGPPGDTAEPDTDGPECRNTQDCADAFDTGDCMRAVCNAVNRCELRVTIDGQGCDDESLCTEDDRCFEGECLGVAVGCVADACAGSTRCEPEFGCTYDAFAADGTRCGGADETLGCDTVLGGFETGATCLDGRCQAGGIDEPSLMTRARVGGSWFIVRTTVSTSDAAPATQSGYLGFSRLNGSGEVTGGIDMGATSTVPDAFSYCIDETGRLAVVTGDTVTEGQVHGDIFLGWRVTAEQVSLTLGVRPHGIQDLDVPTGDYHVASINADDSDGLRGQLGTAAVDATKNLTLSFESDEVRTLAGQASYSPGMGGVTVLLAAADGGPLANPVWRGVISRDKQMILLRPTATTETGRFGMMVLVKATTVVSPAQGTWTFASYLLNPGGAGAKGASGQFDVDIDRIVDGLQSDDQGLTSTLSGSWDQVEMRGPFDLLLRDDRPFVSRFIGFGGVPPGFAIGLPTDVAGSGAVPAATTGLFLGVRAGGGTAPQPVE